MTDEAATSAPARAVPATAMAARPAKGLEDDGVKHLFMWPAFLVVLLVTLFPLIYALTVSFQSVRIVPPMPPRWVGLDNYGEIVASARFWGAIWTTAVIVSV